MKLSNLALSLAAIAVGTAAQAQVTSSVPVQQLPKAQTGVKQAPVKVAVKQTAPPVQHHLQPIVQTGTSFLNGSDNCATPDVIAGPGPHTVDTSAATTGAEGQAEGLCLFFGTMGVTNDVWFTWNAPSTGSFTLSLCGGVTSDSKVAVYAGTTCPTAGTALACNDDFCGLVTQLNFSATAGSDYVIQMGNYPGALGYFGSFTITGAAAAPANDDCTGATPIAGYGTFAVSTIGATGTTATGICAQANNDVWFAWTAPNTENVIVTTCALAAGFDTVLAAWPNACPPAGALACNDDGCGGVGESKFTFAATAGTVYLIQAGAWAAAGTWTGSMDLSAAPPPAPEDSCATPLALGAVGPYPFDTSAATTGLEGQAEALCLFFGSTTIDNDVWYTWTAPSTNNFRLSSCLQTGVDTKVAIYSGTGCPTAGTALACNDDDCNFQSGVVWSATGGTTYTIQFGTFPGAVGGTGTFDITVFTPPPGDDCATPVALVGAGPHAFDTTTATTGTQGQAEPRCNAYGLTGIDHDVWFCWTAPSTGQWDVSTVGLTGIDTKFAVYDGCGCPAAGALGCNDDACGTLQSLVSFFATGGNTYTIQCGVFPGAAGGAGLFSIAPAPPLPPGCAYDDGTTENSIGLTNGGALAWIHRFGQIGQSTTISSISTAYGTAAFPGVGGTNGTPSDLVIWDDSDDDGDPSTGLVHVATIASTIQNVDTDILNSTAVVPAVTVNGVFFVGVAVTHIPGNYPSPLDQSTVLCGGAPLSFIAGDASGVLDYTNMNAANPLPVASLGSQGFDGFWLLRVGCNLEPGAGFCAGDGIDPNVTPGCPCTNFGGPGRGCRSSFNANGAFITATGATALDNVVLQVDGVNPSGNVIFMRGNLNNVSGVTFGDGVRCVDGTLIRRTKPIFAAGQASFPSPTDTVLLSNGWGAANLTPPGSGITAHYMAYYRNAAALFCPPETFNGTNAYVITW
ncbi:MAG: hypothetical protein HZA53_14085 [Planctomycetes bacterium]|nr:hypothetical protein [Planctomycetota bacterium]